MFSFFKLTSHALQAVTIIQGKVNRPDHDQQRWYHRAPTVKPEAADAVVCSW